MFWSVPSQGGPHPLFWSVPSQGGPHPHWRMRLRSGPWLDPIFIGLANRFFNLQLVLYLT